MANFNQKLSKLLRVEFPGSKLELERVGDNRVGGFLVWKGFDHLEHIDRQRKLSAILKKNLDPDQRSRIAVILTMTPEEMEYARQG